jgi:disulfide bond formation protein DsbB
MHRTPLVVLLIALTTSLQGSAHAASPQPQATSRTAADLAPLHNDFNGDGFSDMAASAPFDSVGSVGGAGAVNVIYGSSAGLAATGNQVWSQNSPGILDTAEVDDHFGDFITAGDFNGDGFDDLAVGTDGEDVGAIRDAGVVNVIYGSAAGLTPTGNQLWSQNSPGILDSAETGDAFGLFMIGGDFNGDGFDDLSATGAFEDVGTVADAGAANVIYGSAAGLSATGNQLWSQNSPGILDAAETSDFFGFDTNQGDFNGDGFDDVVYADEGEDVGTIADAGAANAIYGSAAGLSATGNQFWTQDSPGIINTSEASDFFGFGSATGDFNGDGFTDVALPASGEDGPTLADIGAVNVIYGSSAGLAAAGNQFWTQDSPGIQDAAEQSDDFGLYSGAGDFNGDGFADLAAGAAFGEDVGTVVDAGSINVIYGSAAGLAAAGNRFWTQDSPGMLDTAEQFDNFGCAIGRGDFNGDGFEDVAICVQLEDLTVVDQGAAHVMYGTAGGLGAAGNQLWSQDSPGIKDIGEVGDNFGWSIG